MRRRGAGKEEVKSAISKGEWQEAKMGRLESKINFPYYEEWNDEFYETKQVNPVFVKEGSIVTVITVYVFYF